jgi:hypothetical protein
MSVDEGVVAHDYGFISFDESNAAHVGSKSVDLVDAARRGEPVVPAPEVEQLEFVCRSGFIFRFFDIDTTHSVILLDEILREMVADKAARACDKDGSLLHKHLWTVNLRPQPRLMPEPWKRKIL